jgi:hypothetical protein
MISFLAICLAGALGLVVGGVVGLIMGLAIHDQL